MSDFVSYADLCAEHLKGLSVVSVDAAALFALLSAAVDGSGALMAIMMSERGDQNPIDILVKDFNDHAGAQLNDSLH